MRARNLCLSFLGIAVMMIQGTAYAGHYVFQHYNGSSSPNEQYGIKFYKQTMNGMPPVPEWQYVTDHFYDLVYSNPELSMYGYAVNFEYDPAGGVPFADTRVEIWDLNNLIKLSETQATWVP